MARDCHVTNHGATGRKLGADCINILLVEDNPAEARFLHEVLKGAIWHHFRLVHVKRLAEAIAQLQALPLGERGHEPVPTAAIAHALPFELVLLDLTLPDSQGLASLDLLVHHAPSLPIVVLTNTNDDELAVEAVRHGAQDYLFKRQVNQDTLVRSLRYAIERKQAAQALQDINETLELRVQERTAELKATNALLTQEIEERQRIQERLALAQHAGKIGSFEWQIPSHTVTWSPELEALYGRPVGSFANRAVAWLETVHEGDREPTEAALWQALRTGRGLETEFRIVHPGGEIHWIAVKSSVFHDADGHPLRMIGIHMDITEKKQLEAQFLRAQRLESLGTLASGIAHDLNNILTPILAVAQLIPLKLPELDDHTQQLLNVLESSAKRGADLIKQILSFARGVEGKRVSVQLRHLLVEIVQIVEQTLPKSIVLHTQLPNDLWVISGDVTQLHQVFMNLWVNARDAMPNGGCLNITSENCWVDDPSSCHALGCSPGPYVVVTVEDTGSGIPPQILHQIFDPFFTTKAVGKGTGLGLSAVIGIVKSHGGCVDVQTEVNRGSQFRVYLPASPIAAPLPPPALDLRCGHQEWILVVDDELTIRDVLKTALETCNYRVLTADNGESALAMYTEYHQQIAGVLLDLMMPVMDGLTTIPRLRQLNPQVRIVTMTGLDDVEIVAQAKALGAKGTIAKPFTTEELLHVLRLHCLSRSPALPSYSMAK